LRLRMRRGKKERPDERGGASDPNNSNVHDNTSC